MSDYTDTDITGEGYWLVTYGRNRPPAGPFASVMDMARAEGLSFYPVDGYVMYRDGDGGFTSVPSLNPDEMLAPACVHCDRPIEDDDGTWFHPDTLRGRCHDCYFREEIAPTVMATCRPDFLAQHLTETVAATHTTEDLTIIWHTGPRRCCGESWWWDADSPPGVWDRSGLGDWACCSHAQCERCGSLFSPFTTIVSGHLEGAELDGVVARLWTVDSDGRWVAPRCHWCDGVDPEWDAGCPCSPAGKHSPRL